MQSIFILSMECRVFITKQGGKRSEVTHTFSMLLCRCSAKVFDEWYYS